MPDPFNIADLTPEQQRNFQLEAIFMPEARRQRVKFYRENPDPKFVHYTTAEAALSIIEQKRMWLRNTRSMVDYREVRHGFELLQRLFHENDFALQKAFIGACDACKPGAAEEAIGLFDKWWTHTTQSIQTRTYIASISEHGPSEDQHGRLSMWRAFGANASARVAFVFRVPPLSGAINFLKCTFSPVAYLDEDQVRATIQTVISNIAREVDYLKTLGDKELFAWVFAMLISGVTCLKHKGFIEEREWRVIYRPGMTPSPLIAEEVKVVSGIPQVIYKLPLDKMVADEVSGIDLVTMFHSLIIGPASEPWVMYEAFTRALKGAGVADADGRVLTSGIPIRLL